MRKHILYLASGSSRRFGSNKLLHEVRGKPMYRHGLDMLAGLVKNREDCRLLAVSRYEEIRQYAQALGIPAADSPESEKGISFTIRAGLAALGELPEEDFLLFVAADQPWLTAASVARLLDGAGEGQDCACLSWAGCPGNPALFSVRLLPELLALEGDTGGRAVLKKRHCLLVPADAPEELEDIDTREN